MLNPEMIAAVRHYLTAMTQPVELVVAAQGHSKRAELLAFLTEIAGCSEQISVVERAEPALRSGVSFAVNGPNSEEGVFFSGIPGGHEFNSLILAIAQQGGVTVAVDEAIGRLLTAVAEPLQFEVFVSLSCHNCPEVVQTLNGFAALNPQIRCEMIDGALFPELIAERDIQGVPSVYLNGELFANGKIDAGVIVDKLLQRQPQPASAQSDGEVQDITVIGAGPAGVSAAIYSARKGLKVTVIADRIGGQVKDTLAIENLIAVAAVQGPALAAQLEAQLRAHPISLKTPLRVERIEQHDGIEHILLNNGEQVRSRTVIVASGARWRELGVPGEREHIGAGVAYCPHCDGPFFAGKDVAVVGGGNSGIEAALDLAGIVKSVTVVEFMPTLKADQVLIDKARATENITLLTNAAVEQVVAANGAVSHLAYRRRDSGERVELPVAGLFVQIGLVPNTQFIRERVATRGGGEIIVDEKCRTSVPTIFAAGDATTVPYKQIVVAMGEGAKAALAAYEQILLGTQQPAEPVAAAA